MNRYLLFSCIALTVLVCIGPPSAHAEENPVRALIVNDTGGGLDFTVGRMQVFNWIVGQIGALDLLEKTGAELREHWDVIWILPGAEYKQLRLFSKNGGALDTFAQAGGMIVMLGVDASEFRIDAGPGGLDIAKLESPGDTVIGDPEHHFINGAHTLTVADLDPQSTGGGGKLANLPDGCNMHCIAHNDSGSVLAEYEHGTGRVLISLFALQSEPCLNNLVLYITSLVAS